MKILARINITWLDRWYNCHGPRRLSEDRGIHHVSVSSDYPGKSEKDLYLFFVEGFGGLTQLVASFTIVDAALVILFFVAGNVIATVGYKAVVYARRLKQYH